MANGKSANLRESVRTTANPISAMKDFLTPRELAQAVGASESSVKRWVDDGSIRATKTSGGHRRIPIGEVVRFIRSSQAVLVRPDLLGLYDVAAIDSALGGDEAEALFEFLKAGEAEKAKGLILTQYMNGSSVAQIFDDTLRTAMSDIGELWGHDEEGIFVEHRATEIAIQAVMRLRSVLANGPRRATAVGGSVPGDIYRLPTLCAATVLEAAGLEAVNLGPNIPLPSLELAVDRLGVSLVWLSVSTRKLPDKLGDDIRRFADGLAGRGIPVVVGGRSVKALKLRSAGNLRAGGSMAELEAIALGMQFSVHGDRPN